MTMSIIPGLCRYYILRKWLMNIRGHRQFLMTPTAFPQYPQMTPKVPPKNLLFKVWELCPLLLLPSSYPAIQLLCPLGPFQLPTQSAVLQLPSHPAPSILFGSSILHSPPVPLPSSSPPLQLPSSSATPHPAYLPYSIPSSPLFPFSAHPAPLPSCSLPVTISSSLYSTEPELWPFLSSSI